jgi:integrase
VIESTHYYAKVGGVPVRLARDKNAAEQILANKRKQFERVEAGLELPEPDQKADLDTLLAQYDKERLEEGLTDKYRNMMRRRLRRILTDLRVTRVGDIRKLTMPVIEAAVSQTFECVPGARGPRGRPKQVTASKETRWLNIVSLRAFFNWLVEKRLVGMLPKMPVARRSTRARGALTRDQVEKLAAVAKPKYALFYRLGFATLARVGALCALRIRDVHFVLNDQGRPSSGTVSLLAEHSKTNTPLAVSLPPMVIDQLFDYVAKTRAGNATEETRLFPVHPHHVSRIFALDAKKAGIERMTPDGKLTPHSLRHGGATHLLKNGVSPFKVMRIGGWKDMGVIVRHYGHVIAADGADDQDKHMR